MVYVLQGSEDGLYAVYSSASKALRRALEYGEAPSSVWWFDQSVIRGVSNASVISAACKSLRNGGVVGVDFDDSVGVTIYPMEVEK